MWPFKKIRINTRDRKEREISFLGITIIQYGRKETSGIKEKYLKIFPKCYESKVLDKIISFLPKENKYDHVWVVRTTGMGEALLLNYMMDELKKNWKVKNPCIVSQREVYKELFAMYTDTPFYVLNMQHDDYSHYLRKRDVKYKGKYFHVHHCTIDESLALVAQFRKGEERRHALDVYREWAGIEKYYQATPTFSEEIRKCTLKKIEGMNLNLDKFIFLSPEAKTTKEIDSRFWEKISHIWEKRGYDVYVNTSDGKTTFGKSTCLGVAEACYLASRAKRIIALRCGFAEVLAAVKERGGIYVLYPRAFKIVEAEEFYRFFGLRNYPFYDKNNTFELIVKREYLDEIILRVTEPIDERKEI